jgi:YfiH family protein
MTAPPATSFELRQQGTLPAAGWPALDGRGAEILVTTRDGGVSAGPYATLNLSFSVGDDPGAVRENRQRVAAARGAELGDFVFARQVHGARAVVVSAADRGRGTTDLAGAVPDADALVTRDPAIVLAILTADCVPIVLHDPVAGVLAAVHAGWRGTAAGAVPAALDVMQALGSRPAGVIAGLGPAIGADRYQVGTDVRDGIGAALGEAASAVLRPDGTGRWLLDLHDANRRQLTRAGVPASQIHPAGVATGPGGPFFSDRTARPCGRFALVARLTGDGQPDDSGRRSG